MFSVKILFLVLHQQFISSLIKNQMTFAQAISDPHHED